VRPRILASIVVLMLGAATVAQAHPLAQAQGGPEQSRGATDVEGRGPEAGAAELPFAIDGPPPPALPERISRDDSGRATIRAIGLAEPLRLDGRLDEMVYEQEQAISDFIQTDPVEGAAATEKTELWVMFDRQNVYVAFRVWESQRERRVANVMQKDNGLLFQNDGVMFVFDPFYDRRNGVGFMLNAIGGRTDGQVTDERWSRDWNMVWDVKVADFDGGWTAEVALPFKSLRYRPGTAQVWGFNARRIDRWKNEYSHLMPVERQEAGSGVYRMSRAATVIGLEAPPGSKNLEFKPYVISNASAVHTPNAPNGSNGSNDLTADVGIDAKYGITQNLTADFTVNTDFAQVEADEQQINLTRFSLFFPEKRDFFLENAGLFAFGGANSFNAGRNDIPLLFYSRRIGLNAGQVVPIDAGARLSGRVGRYTVGVMDIQGGSEAVSGTRATNFSAVRVKRDVLSRSSIGVIATGRSVTQDGAGSNAAYGLDGAFGFFTNLAVDAYWARTATDGVSGGDTSYRGAVNYNGLTYGLQAERLVIGEHFNPAVGFVRRSDIRKSFAQARYSPWPKSMGPVRRISLVGSIGYVENGVGQLEARDVDGELAVDFNTSDRISVGYSGSYELVPLPFRLGRGVTVPAGGYDYGGTTVAFQAGQQRKLNGRVSLERGSLYDGTKTTIGLSTGRATLSPQLSVEPTFSVNDVDLPQGSFVTTLIGSRVTYTMTPLMFASALVQYNSDARNVSANVRLRWEYRPGSELFVVYNEERDTLTRGVPDVRNRAFIVKVNRLLRF
jgi:hypothetical protein